jgi:hypothetical protein|tara:strand:- start:387 stop:1484 length:1098 start_codon:yes stop_codon:yes gene_type:complete
MNLPITSRVKRSAILKTSALKLTEKEKAEKSAQQGGNLPPTSIVGAGEDVIVNKTETVVTGPTEKFEGELATGKKAEEWAKQKAFCDGKPLGTPGCSGFHKSEGGGTEEITTQVVEKGDDVEAQTAKKREGKVQTNFEARQLGRQTKFKNRLARQSKIKQAKNKAKGGGTFDEEGNYVKGTKLKGKAKRQFIKDAKLKAKAEENRRETSDFESAADNQSEVMRSGKTIGQTTRRDTDRTDTTADMSKPELIATERARLKRERLAEENNITTSGDKAIEPDSPGKMKTSAYKMKAKSPATKKLQGNQGNLPQHLQDSIKAAPAKFLPLAAIAGKALVGALASKAASKVASAGKMRSSFKMKGYGKK